LRQERTGVRAGLAADDQRRRRTGGRMVRQRRRQRSGADRLRLDGDRRRTRARDQIELESLRVVLAGRQTVDRTAATA
jgi:hypothetical protein